MNTTGWVSSQVTGQINTDGAIRLTSSNHVLMEGPKPASLEESGNMPADWERILNRTTGAVSTKTHIGGALAIVVRTSALKLFGSERLDQRLWEKMKVEIPPGMVHIGCIRNIGAPTSQLWAEAYGGMVTSLEFELEQLMEGIGECLVYKEDGYARVLLPEHLSQFQEKVDEEVAYIWNCVNPGFPQKYEVSIEILPIGCDSLDNRVGFAIGGPVGDLGFLSIAQLNLPETGDWMVRDGELYGETPLNRRSVMIAPRPGRSPVMLTFDLNGGLDGKGLFVPLSGEVVEDSISHLLKASLGRRGLAWLRLEDCPA